jgi:hypothetical protein
MTRVTFLFFATMRLCALILYYLYELVILLIKLSDKSAAICTVFPPAYKMGLRLSILRVDEGSGYVCVVR